MTTLSTISTITGAVSNVWNMVGQQKSIETALSKLSQDQMILLADQIRDIFTNSDILDPPTLCVVGTQSSGKSITLNGLTGIDILPNGKSIVTRTPIHLRLIHTKDTKNIKVDINDRDNNNSKSFIIDNDINKDTQLNLIRQEITRLTEQYAGTTKNVVDKPIDIIIKSPNVPNLSVIDLPGLTHIALTDQGQPTNIKDNIEKMITKYIKNPRTLIISIIPATVDVEADMGLGLIKMYDPEFKRTIGVLTKVDLLKDSNVEAYLSGKISKSLQLGYGYYAVRNRSSDEIKSMSVIDGLALESKFFNETEPYKSSDTRSRMGMSNLGNKLSEILLAHLKTYLPTVITEIKNMEKTIDTQLNQIGRDYPTTETAKRTYVNILIQDFQREYIMSIRERGGNYGAKIANSLKNLTDNLEKLEPFNQSIITDQMIADIVRDYNGIHMPDMTISTGIIEKFFENDSKKNNPIIMMKSPVIQCMKEIQVIMNDLVDNILQKDKYCRFPKFCVRSKDLISQIINTMIDKTSDKINDFFREETEYIWTDDQKFRQEILPCAGKNIRNTLNGYFIVIRNIAIHTMRKKIVVFFVNDIINEINTNLYDFIVKQDINVILEENKKQADERKRLIMLRSKIDQAKTMINSMSI